METELKLNFCSIISRAILVRILYLCIILISIWRVVEGYGIHYWSISVLTLPLIIEGIYRLVKYKGIESNKWFCICFLLYLVPNVACIWLLQMKYNRCILNNNSAIQTRTPSQCEGETIDFTTERIFGVRVVIPQMSQLNWIVSIQQVMVLLLVVGRCILPNELVDRFRLARLLLAVIANGADVIEFYQIQGDMDIRSARDSIVYVHLAVWTLSLLPFCFFLTATDDDDNDDQPNTETTNGSIEMQNQQENETRISKRVRKRHLMRDLLIDERWTLIMQSICMDAPYLVMRIYIMYRYKLLTSSVLFFVAKNAILLIVDVVLFCLLCCSDERKEARKARQKSQALKTSRKKDTIAVTPETNGNGQT